MKTLTILYIYMTRRSDLLVLVARPLHGLLVELARHERETLGLVAQRQRHGHALALRLRALSVGVNNRSQAPACMKRSSHIRVMVRTPLVCVTL